MGYGGVKFNPEISSISDILLKFKGNIRQTAKHYDVCRETIYLFMEEHPELKEVREKARKMSYQDMLDGAEFVMAYGLEKYEDDYKKAFEAAKYILDKLGPQRDWGKEIRPEHDKEVNNLLTTLISQSKEAYNKIKEEE